MWFDNDFSDEDHEGFVFNLSLFKKCLQMYHPAHMNFQQFFDFLANPDIDEEFRLLLMKNRLAHFCEHLPKNFSEIGMAELMIAKQCDKMGLKKEGLTHVKKAEEILGVVLGSDHPCLKNAVLPIKIKLNPV